MIGLCELNVEWMNEWINESQIETDKEVRFFIDVLLQSTTITELNIIMVWLKKKDLGKHEISKYPPKNL